MGGFVPSYLRTSNMVREGRDCQVLPRYSNFHRRALSEIPGCLAAIFRAVIPAYHATPPAASTTFKLRAPFNGKQRPAKACNGSSFFVGILAVCGAARPLLLNKSYMRFSCRFARFAHFASSLVRPASMVHTPPLGLSLLSSAVSSTQPATRTRSFGVPAAAHLV
jgi:hypothetical protein